MNLLKNAYKENACIAISEVSVKYHIPYYFLEKIASALKDAGIIKSLKGRSGGYLLVKNPKEITIDEIINVFEKPKMMRCLESGGGKSCVLSASCPTMKLWNLLDKKMSEVFKKTTLAEL